MTTPRPNLFGDLRAEVDHKMLEVAFYETPDYKTLLEHTDYNIIVGRRGVGKSALFYRLSKFWEKSEKLNLVKLCPEDFQVIGLRAFIRPFGNRVSLVNAGSKIAWKYALIMEILSALSKNYKFKGYDGEATVLRHVQRWQGKGHGFIEKLRYALEPFIQKQSDSELLISELNSNLELPALEEALQDGLKKNHHKTVLLLDRLDEGYEPDTVGIGLLVGLVHAAIDVMSKFHSVKVLVFLRDNIYRSISRQDPSYSRTVENHVLRVHWDEKDLFSLMCNRIRVALGVKEESNIKTWNCLAAHDLQGMDGFRKCLKHTLYRPRDLLSLINQAYYFAQAHNSNQLIYSHIETVSKEISLHRLNDLFKEYEVVFPSLEKFVTSFSSLRPELSYEEALSLVEIPLKTDDSPPTVQQNLALFHDPPDVVQSLHSVGFIGLQDPITKTFVYCHDGKASTIMPTNNTRLLIHPCYWMALNLSQVVLDKELAAEINDEYDIQVTSITADIRNAKLGRQIASLQKIRLGHDGAQDFENWVLESLRILLAGKLRNLEHKPNGAGIQRRDIVATNHGNCSVWKRIIEDYESRQIIFEMKNYEELIGGDEYRQMNSYLAGPYGKLGFIVNRAHKMDLEKGSELDFMREMHALHGKLIIRITGKFLCDLLSKLRSHSKQDQVDDQFDKLLDRYERLYLSLQSTRTKRK